MSFVDSPFSFRDARLFRRFGNLTASSTGEVLVSTRAYVEQGSQAQRAVQSTSSQDSSGGTGAKAVRITYLDSAYVLKTEDVTLNGTTKVNTVATDIRFIERFEVIQGAAAVGAIQLMTGTTGGASEFCGIAVATTEAFLCHHYVPAGYQAWVLAWEATSDDDVNLKLYGQDRFGANLVDRILDLEKLYGAGVLGGGATLDFARVMSVVKLPEKTYLRITAAPGQSTATVIRTRLYFWEEAT
jgi:hypothetical protein